jgi:hypothetical protein
MSSWIVRDEVIDVRDGHHACRYWRSHGVWWAECACGWVGHAPTRPKAVTAIGCHRRLVLEEQQWKATRPAV